jgi:integrase
MTNTSATLADVIRALSDLLELPARTRSDLASAVRIFCRATGLDPTTAEAGDLPALQACLARAVPERIGLSSARWSVVRSQVLRALMLTGAAAPLKTADTRLSPGWQDLIAAIPQPRLRHALSRFGRFCVQQGIEPPDVNQEVFDHYREALMERSLVRNPQAVHHQAAQAWAELPEGLAGLSGTRIEVPSVGTQRAPGRRPLSAFPASFVEELAAFGRWCLTADPLDEGARAKALRPQTVISYRSNLHTAADAAVRSGVAIAEVTSIAVLTRPSVYREILRHLLRGTDQKATANVHGVATVVLIVARDWLRQSPEELAALKTIKAKLPKLRPGLTQKNRDLLAAFDDHALLRRFLLLSDELWKEALNDKLARNQRLVRAQMSLLIGILQIVPLRRKNMCALLFDKHVTWPNGPSAPALIQVPVDETKTELDFVAELPLELSRRLHLYRTRLAPQLTGKVPTHLFVATDGRPKRQESVTNRLVVFLAKRLGLSMTMHQFRHLVGKLMLDDNPGAYEAVAQILGHAGTKNVVRFYGGADTRRATRHHARLIEKLRAEANQHRSRRRKT